MEAPGVAVKVTAIGQIPLIEPVGGILTRMTVDDIEKHRQTMFVSGLHQQF